MDFEAKAKEIIEAVDNLDAKQAAAVEAVIKEGNEAVEAVKAEFKGQFKELLFAQEELEAKLARFEDGSAKPGMSEEDIKAADYAKTFVDWAKKGDRYEDELETKATDLQISTPASGGYALPEELVRSIIKLEQESSPIRGLVDNKLAGTTDIRQLVSTGSAASGWVGETSSRTQTNAPDLAERVATFGEVYAMPRAYQHVLEDAFFDVTEWLAGEVSREFEEVSNVAFLEGDGTNKPVGILDGVTLGANAAANDTTGVYQVLHAGENQLGADAAAIIDFLRTVPLSLKTGYLKGAKWMMNRATHNILVNLKNSDGEYFLQRDITNAAAKTLFGYDIVINEDMDDVDEAADTAPIIFGDFKRAFRVYDRVGMSTLRDPYTNKGSVMFYTRKRVGSMVLDASALKVVSVGHS